MMINPMISFDIASWPPGLMMILAAFAVPWIPHVARQIWMLAAIALSAWGLSSGAGVHAVWQVMGLELVLYRADNLTFPFALIFQCDVGLFHYIFSTLILLFVKTQISEATSIDFFATCSAFISVSIKTFPAAKA